MGALVNVVLSSMGPRREPMMFTSTTAGTIKTGPFVDKLEGMKRELLKELSLPPTPPEGKGVLQSPNDRWMILPLCPDDWQIEDEYLLTNTTVRRKVNPALGVIVQNSFYEQKVASSRLDPLEKVETLTKLFNVYQNNKVTDWVKAEEIREVQVERRIDDCIDSEGWEVYVGSDFSKGDDLNGNSYLAVRWREDLGEMEFFADLDAYMSEEAVNDSPVRELLLKWSREGWLHIVPGKTFDPAVAVNRIVELNDKGVNFFGFGYDPYNAKTVINALTQWVVSDLGLDPKKLIRPVRQNFATYSPAVKEFDYMLRRGVQTQDGKTHPSPMIHFSTNPLWPWEFSNCVLMESTDGMENMKPVKASSAASCKVDNVQMLLSALILYDANE
jgi:phage terminase large subunit-like protein